MRKIKTQQDYDALQKELFALEEKTGLYLADETVDRENVQFNYVLPDEEEAFWSHMYSAACMAAGMRAEEAGVDLYKLSGGRIAY